MKNRTSVALLLTVGSLSLFGMPTREEAENELPMVKRLLQPQYEAMKEGRISPSELAKLALFTSEAAATPAAKLLLCKASYKLFLSDGRFEEAFGALEKLRKQIPDISCETLVNIALSGQDAVPFRHADAYRKYMKDVEDRINRQCGGDIGHIGETLQDAPAVGRPQAAPQPASFDVYVSADGDDRADGSEKHPFATIEKAVDAAKSGATIGVGPGEYECAVEIKGKYLRLVAVSSEPGATVLRGRKGRSVIFTTTGSDHTVIRGFVITGGSGNARPSSYGHDYYGGGICAGSAITIENCIIRGNGKGVARKTACTFGGGVWADGGCSVKIVNCLIVDNFAWACGGGVGLSGEIDIRDSTVVDNESTSFFGNQAGIGLAQGSTCTALNLIIWGNKGDQLGAFGGPYSQGTRCGIENSVVQYGVSACGIRQFAPQGCSETDPEFVDADVKNGCFRPGNGKVVVGYRADR